MAFEQIPVRSDLPAYEFKIPLDGVNYILRFAWSERSALWSMDIMGDDESQILMGVRLFTGEPLIDRFTDERLPPRSFLCLDTGDSGKNPGRDDFGSRVLLLYGDDS